MSEKILIHIVPALHPQTDGAGDYALKLALELRQSHGIQSRFLVCSPEREGPSRVEGFATQRLRLRNEACVWSLLASAKEQQASFLLHYCPYGYDKNGLPRWLYRGIDSWLQEQSTRTGCERGFYTVFHEGLPSSSTLWKKEFCLQIPQKWLLQEIHRRSGLSVTSSRNLQAFLDSVEPHKTLWLPAPGRAANEPDPDWKLIARDYHAALFERPTHAKASVGQESGSAEELNGPAVPGYPSVRVVEHPVGIRPRPA